MVSQDVHKSVRIDSGYYVFKGYVSFHPSIGINGYAHSEYDSVLENFDEVDERVVELNVRIPINAFLPLTVDIEVPKKFCDQLQDSTTAQVTGLQIPITLGAIKSDGSKSEGDVSESIVEDTRVGIIASIRRTIFGGK